MSTVNNKILRTGEGVTDLEHIALSFVHGGFEPDQQGGCSCDICGFLRMKAQIIRANEAKQFMQETYGTGTQGHQRTA